jgi:general secretion pathway protein D
MVFIRPTILRSADDARAMSARRYGYARGQQMLSNPNREPTLDELVRDYLGTVPPAVPAERQPQDAVVTPAETPSGPATPQ